MPQPSLTAAVLDASMDAVVTVDHTGRIQGWNPSAEQMFGHRAADVLGHELGATIVPPDLRAAHRSGLQRFAGGGPGRIPGGRTETTGLRTDGSTFPVELTITRVAGGEDGRQNVVFVGFLRDLTEHRRLVDDLQDSRIRLMRVFDDARRRLERDLHDGAQQQLVAVAIALRSIRRQLDVDPAVAAELLERCGELMGDAIDELRELARGVHNSILTERGLGAAVAHLARRSPIDVEVAVDLVERLPSLVETSLYYLVTEAVTNSTRYGAHHVRIEVNVASVAGGNGRVLCAVIGDDGPGGADPHGGTGIVGMTERLLALGGTVDVVSPRGHGTTISVAVPLPT